MTEKKKYRPEKAAVQKAVEAGDISALRTALTPMQRKFCEEYVIDMNATAACIRAGYSPKNAEKQAHLLMINCGVAYLIDDLMRSKEAKITSVDPDYIVQKIVSIVNKEGAKDGDKLRGLELLARHLGMFIDRQEITGKDGEAIRVQQQKVAEEASRFDDLLRKLADRAGSDKKEITLGEPDETEQES